MDDFEKLYRTYFQYVYFYILRLSNNQQVAEEITQETFFTAMNTKAQFENKSDVRTWLCKIAHNKYISLLRKQKKLAEYTMEDKSAAEMDILEKIIKREDSLKIHRYLHQLEEPYKEVFSLRVFSELSFKDIGRIFEKSDAWARVTYSRAKMKLAERMGRMKINCNVIKDLIVLHDAEGCSIDSEQLIEDHIASCETCRILWENTQSVKVDGLIAQPIDNFDTMCRRIKKKSKKRTILFSVFWAIAAVIITLLAIKFVRMPHTLTSNEIQVADVYYEEGMLVFKIETKNGSAIGTSSGYILESCGKEGKYILSTWCDKFAGRAEQEIDAAFFIQTYWDISELYMKNENGEKEIIWENNGDYSALTEEIKEEIEYTKQYRE